MLFFIFLIYEANLTPTEYIFNNDIFGRVSKVSVKVYLEKLYLHINPFYCLRVRCHTKLCFYTFLLIDYVLRWNSDG